MKVPSLLFLLAMAGWLPGCGGGGSTTAGPAQVTPPANSPTAKSSKRGIAYDLATSADLAALAPGVSWWYNWSPGPNPGLPANSASALGMGFVPMLWNGSFDATAIKTFLSANPGIGYLLVLNEPNLVDQADTTPQQAALLWPQYEAVAAQTGVKLVGPAMTWGTMAGYQDPVAWLDAFYAAYGADNGMRQPQIDALAFHWYDYGLDAQLDRLTKYGKPFWVTEFANWHSQADGAQITTLAGQEAQMTAMVATCEGRDDVVRYAWFTGRWNPDPHFTSLLGAPGALTPLGTSYLALPWQ